ncbi:MAG: HPr family phosphocarrier protein [Alphaproteobacteria bacterium]|nr:HPr family phosphocarrier protein [Alphaproteobacteria bacterium]
MTPQEEVSCVRQIVEVVNVRGLHARAAARFVKLAESFNADIQVCHAHRTVPGTSLMGLLLLGARQGTFLEIVCTGAGADEALKALVSLVQNKFTEEF